MTFELRCPHRAGIWCRTQRWHRVRSWPMAIGLGCMRLSTDPARDPDRGRAVIGAALGAGIDLLDTADAYAFDDRDAGHNERLIAEVTRLAGRRIEVVTKGGLVRPGG